MRKLILVMASLLVAAPVAGQEPPRDVTVDDVVQSRQLSEPEVSPDGTRAAVVVAEPSVARNVTTSRVLVVDVGAPDRGRVVATVTGTTDRITNLRWSPDGKSLAYLAPAGGADEVWQVPAAGGTPSKLFASDGPAVAIGGKHEAFRLANVPPHQAKVLAFEWSPDGKSLAFTTPRPGGRPTEDGVPYDERTMDLRTLETGEYDQVRNGLWLLDTPTGRIRHVTDSVMGPLADAGEPKMAWSPDSTRLAFATRASQKPTDDRDALQLLDVQSGNVSTVDTAGARVLPPAWSPDGKTVLVQRADRLEAVPVAGGPGVPVAALPAGVRFSASGAAWWSPSGDHVLVATADDRRESLYSAAQGATLAPVVAGADTLSDCSLDTPRGTGVCVRQNVGSPPRLTLVDTATGALRDGYNPNRWAAGVRLTPPVAAEWTTPAGHRATGYELVPPACGRERSCPAVVITHGYDAVGRFMSEAQEWQYPSQVFAAQGYVVLLVNESRESPDSREAVAMMETAVKPGIAAGRIDANRVGIMGYSRGAQISQEALAWSTVFRAASTGEGGSPVLMPGTGQTTDRLNGPLLQQMGPAAGSWPLSIYQYVKSLKVPTAMVLFQDETHLFHQPGHRAAAMRQNVEWFHRWLSV